VDLIISEKEEAGRAIASALGVSEVSDEVNGRRITYFRGSNIIIVPAKGHLYEPLIKKLTFAKLKDLPLTEIKWTVKRSEWVKIDKDAEARIKLIKSLGEQSDQVVVATDWDREGEAIGYNICRFGLGLSSLSDFKRMYFSALTPKYIIQAYNNLREMDETLLVKGLARSIADSIIGLNITKALTLRFKQLYPEVRQAFSLGRVQSPLLAYIVGKVSAEFKVQSSYSEREEVNVKTFLVYKDASVEVYEEIEGEQLSVINVEDVVDEVVQAIPLPNTDDMMEAVKELSPDMLMKTMEQMYLKGWLTYPRTKSRWCPREMLQDIYGELVKYVELTDSFKVDNSPSLREAGEGGKTAITLTPEGIKAYYAGEMSLVERIVAAHVLERMVKTFAPPLRRKITYVVLSDGVGEFKVKWCEDILNNPVEYVSAVVFETFHVREVPRVGDKVRVVKIKDKVKVKKIYQPYELNIVIPTDHSLVEWMTYRGLGTEATRHQFPVTLRTRNYINTLNIPTMLGSKVAEIIEKIGLSADLTAEMESRIEELGKLSELENFKSWIADITRKLVENIRKLSDEDFMFKCPKGHHLQLRQYGIRGNIIGQCSTCAKKYIIT